ncbi:MAG TPA: MerR family transcriptional regulator [Acidimicrobiales bacterium]|nr:MerR family transcriptional regulator [Acidimicrobiales bacterium]
MNSRPYLSIGDVLTLLRQEFPDVTISKIRFLESQGLVDPERTPSGYRKFYEPDVERLRWVLRQQREHFLPLKVIKGRLESHPQGQGNGRSVRVGAGPGGAATGASRRRGSGPPLPGMGTGGQTSEGSEHVRAPGPAPASAVIPVPDAAKPAAATSEPAADDADRAARTTDEAAPTVDEGTNHTAAEPVGRSGPAKASQAPKVLAEGDMTLEDLGAASGCSAANLQALESYGLLSGRPVGGVAYYGEQALEVARLAKAFAGFGVEPRHLRLHKHAVEREAGFIEQVVLPLLKQRNPESRQRAHDTVAELARLGQELRAVLLARVLRDQLGG